MIKSMLRAAPPTAASIFRAASRWSGIASSPAPSITAVVMTASPHTTNMMLSTTSFSLGDANITSASQHHHDHVASATATTTPSSATTAALSIKDNMNYFMVSASNTYTTAITKFIRGGDLSWSMISSSHATVASSSSSSSRMMEVVDDGRMEEQEVGDDLGENSRWNDIVTFPTKLESSSATTIVESSSSSVAAALASALELLDPMAIWQISTLKRRKKMMNKHKLQKRRKKLRLKTRK